MLLAIGLLFIIGNFPQVITVPVEFVVEFFLERIIPQPLVAHLLHSEHRAVTHRVRSRRRGEPGGWVVRSLGFCWNGAIGDGEAWFPVELHEHKRHLLPRIRLQQREQHP